ncbi:hypothetical protein H4R33_002752 [Dimargaris cristalligena]|nr:hypothetical protein H4R33_002752 [Dimargaris cristalligena]
MTNDPPTMETSAESSSIHDEASLAATTKATANLQLASPKRNFSFEEKVIMKHANELIQDGKKAYALDDYEDSVQSFGEASELIGGVFDETSSTEYADVMILYGQALLRNAIGQSAIMAGAQLQSALSAQPKEDESESAPTGKANFHFEGEPDFRQLDECDADASSSSNPSAKPQHPTDDGQNDGSDDENEAQGDEAGAPGDDFSMAWEVLELARLIYAKKVDPSEGDEEDGRSDPETHPVVQGKGKAMTVPYQPKPEHQRKLAEILQLLGDVSLETEFFAEAIIDYEKALAIREALPHPDPRETAACLYMIALAQEYQNKYADALVTVDKITSILERVLGSSATPGVVPQSVTASPKSGPGASSGDSSELPELLTEVRAKREDLCAMLARQREQGKGTGGSGSSALQLLDEALRPTVTGGSGSDGAGLARPDPSAPVNDLTSLVRSKRQGQTGKGKAPEHTGPKVSAGSIHPTTATPVAKRKIDDAEDDEATRAPSADDAAAEKRTKLNETS